MDTLHPTIPPEGWWEDSLCDRLNRIMILKRTLQRRPMELHATIETQMELSAATSELQKTLMASLHTALERHYETARGYGALETIEAKASRLTDVSRTRMDVEHIGRLLTRFCTQGPESIIWELRAQQGQRTEKLERLFDLSDMLNPDKEGWIKLTERLRDEYHSPRASRNVKAVLKNILKPIVDAYGWRPTVRKVYSTNPKAS